MDKPQLRMRVRCRCWSRVRVGTGEKYHVRATYTQRIPLPQTMVHWAMLEGAFLRRAVAHLDYAPLHSAPVFLKPYTELLRDHVVSLSTAELLAVFNFDHLVSVHEISALPVDQVVETVREMGRERRNALNIAEVEYHRLVQIFSILGSDSVERLLRSEPNYTALNELHALLKLTRISTPGEQKRFATFLCVVQDVLRESEWSLSRPLHAPSWERAVWWDGFPPSLQAPMRESMFLFFDTVDMLRVGEVSFRGLLGSVCAHGDSNFAESVLLRHMARNVFAGQFTLQGFTTLVLPLALLPDKVCVRALLGLVAGAPPSHRDVLYLLERSREKMPACDYVLLNVLKQLPEGQLDTPIEHLLFHDPMMFVQLFYFQRRVCLGMTRDEPAVWQNARRHVERSPRAIEALLDCLRESTGQDHIGIATVPCPRPSSCGQRIYTSFRYKYLCKWLDDLDRSAQRAQRESPDQNLFRSDWAEALLWPRPRFFAVIRGRTLGDHFRSWYAIEMSVAGVDDMLYFECASKEHAVALWKTWGRRARKSGWWQLWDILGGKRR